jgi:peptidoglycan/xylan/chitin deacetylase (PgdA/CDA1 family)
MPAAERYSSVEGMRVLNLNFHGVGRPKRLVEPREESFWIGSGTLTEILDGAVGRDYLRLSFDDGNCSDVDVALPGLVERDLRATFFLTAGLIGEPGYVDRADVRELVAAGMTVGCHGMRHRAWCGLDVAALMEELVDARRLLESVASSPVREAACPFGLYDRRTLKYLRETGYKRVFTSDGGWADPAAWLQPRATVIRNHGAEIVNGHRWQDSTAGNLSRRIKGSIKRLR